MGANEIKDKIEKLKKTRNRQELYIALLDIFELDKVDGVEKSLAEITKMDRSVFYRMGHPKPEEKEKPYKMIQQNYSQLCKYLADKLGISQEEVAELTKHSLILQGGKTENTKEDVPINDFSQEKIRKQLCDEISYILDKLGYHWKDNQPKDSGLECAITGKVQYNPNPDEEEIYRENELSRVFGASVSERNINDVVAWVADMEPKEKGLIILCCDGCSTFHKVRDRKTLGKKSKKNIWIKEFGNDNIPQLQSYYRGRKDSMKDVMERLLKRLLVSNEISQFQPDKKYIPR